jgi:hypothetical protein
MTDVSMKKTKGRKSHDTVLLKVMRGSLRNGKCLRQNISNRIRIRKIWLIRFQIRIRKKKFRIRNPAWFPYEYGRKFLCQLYIELLEIR